jgi:hypothetical protein
LLIKKKKKKTRKKKKKKNSLFCASKISNCHIPSNSNLKKKKKKKKKFHIPCVQKFHILGELLREILSCLFSFIRTERELSSERVVRTSEGKSHIILSETRVESDPHS